MIIKYAIALAVVLLLAAIARLGVPAVPLPARQPGPAPADPAAPAAAPRQGLRPRLQPVAALGPPGRPAPLGPDPPRRSRCGTGSRTRASTRSILGRAHYRHRLHVPLEEHLLVMAPPRTYKTAFLADVILRYPGPVIATSTKPDLYHADQRACAPSTARCTCSTRSTSAPSPPPSAGPRSTDARTRPPPSAAPTRSRSPSRQKAVEDATFWSAKASDYLRGYFHAAALARYDLRTVAAWVSGADPDVPERILLAAGARQWAQHPGRTALRSPQDRGHSPDGHVQGPGLHGRPRPGRLASCPPPATGSTSPPSSTSLSSQRVEALATIFRSRPRPGPRG